MLSIGSDIIEFVFEIRGYRILIVVYVIYSINTYALSFTMITVILEPIYKGWALVFFRPIRFRNIGKISLFIYY